MTQSDGSYDMKPEEQPPVPPPPAAPAPPKPGEPGWVPPVPVIEKADAESAGEPTVDSDIEQNKGIALLGYICFLIPLVVAPNSKFARYHANQGLLSFIFWCFAILGVVALNVIQIKLLYRIDDIKVLAGFFNCMVYLLEPALLIAALALTLYGIIQAANGERKPLPIIGQVSLIK